MAKIWLALLLVATLGSVDLATSAISEQVKDDWNDFKVDHQSDMDNCKSSSSACDYSTVDNAIGNDSDTLCEEIDTYSACATGCTPPFDQTKLVELKNDCVTGPASPTSNPGTSQPGTASPTSNPGTSQPGTATPTSGPGTPQPTKDPADAVKDAWKTFKQSSPGTNCIAKCPASGADTGVGGSDLTIICQTVRDYTGCAVANCSMSKTDPLLVALTKPCPDGDDDGCSILQVSILALMLSLLLSII